MRPKKEKDSEDLPNSSSLPDQSTSTSETINTDFSQVKVKQEEDDYNIIWSSNQPQQSTIETESNIETEMDQYLSELFM